MSQKSLAAIVCSALFAGLFGCAPIPRPLAVDEADAMSQAPAALEAKQHAEPAWLRAEERRRAAHAELDAGLAAHAQFLAEEAMAGYHEAAALARVAKAAARAAKAEEDATALDRELARVEGELARTTADADALSVRLRAAQGNPVAGDAPKAAEGALFDARLTCVAARLLSPARGGDAVLPADTQTALDEAFAKLDAASKVASNPTSKGGEAEAARTACVEALGRVRRGMSKSPAGGSSDALLLELSKTFAKLGDLDAKPSRDERGVVVTLPDDFGGGKLGKVATARLELLDQIAAAHPAFPVAIVVRSTGSGNRPDSEALGAAVAERLSHVPSSKRHVFVGEGPSRSERSAGTRVELVFVAPEKL